MKRVIVSGLLGFVVIVVWMVLVNGILGFQSRMTMKRIDGEREVYETLKVHITEPGRYTCNPEPTAEGRYPEGEPAYGILYGGVGHEAAGRDMLLQLPIFIVSPFLAAWLLSAASPHVRSRYGRRVLFVSGIGLLVAVWGRLREFGIASYPARDALVLAAHDLALWILVGVVVSARMGPQGKTVPVGDE
jgi:hypothetical protein